jgi:soluble lytic murein transglycosylase
MLLIIFRTFYNNVGYPISLARGAYWLGTTYKSLGDKDLSYKYFNDGAKFPMTYYGQLSFNEIKPGENFELIDESKFIKDYEKDFRKNKLINHVILLTELDASQLAKDIIKYLATLGC